jgi:UDP-N-acetylmuramoyl-tripeptide--D-alanyl-D-alanine ligase
LDGVARAKFQLAEAVCAQVDGQVIIHESVLLQDYAKTFVGKDRKRFIICGFGQDVDLKIDTLEQTTIGLNVSLYWQGREYKLFAPLFGLHHASNMALAFAAALIVGMPPERAVAALRTVPQIKHRLEVKQLDDGTIYIDDGFNSNQNGFLSALDLLSKLGTPDNRRILITPGIVELGDRHDEVHRILGTQAAQKTDLTFVVRADKIPSFVDAFHKQDKNKPLYLVSSLAEALDSLRQQRRAGDIILIENDLPDLGETRMKL